MKRLLVLIVLLSILCFGMSGCVGGLGTGNLIGTVVRDGTGAAIPFPLIVIGKTLKSPLTPDQIFQGDADGRFEITVPGGNYNVQIGTNPDGPFFMWPDVVYIEEYNTVVALFSIPEGF